MSVMITVEFKIKPEKVIYYPEELDVRSGWDLIQEFILQ